MRLMFLKIIFCCLFLCFLSTYATAALQFNSTFPLTLGLPGDNPDITRVAYNSRHNEYLVIYQYRNDILNLPTQIHAARVSAGGEYIANYTISDLPNNCVQPDVAYDPLLDRYLVVWSYDISTPQDGPFWDIYGRFVPWSGPVDTLASFEIASGVNECGNCFHLPVDEKFPRIAYSQSNRDFLVVMETFFFQNPSCISGYRVKTDESHWKNLLIGPHDTTPLSNPDVAYNSVRDEFMVVYDDDEDIYSLAVPGQQSVGDCQINLLMARG